jgi:hypothetical protein
MIFNIINSLLYHPKDVALFGSLAMNIILFIKLWRETKWMDTHMNC